MIFKILIYFCGTFLVLLLFGSWVPFSNIESIFVRFDMQRLLFLLLLTIIVTIGLLVIDTFGKKQE